MQPLGLHYSGTLCLRVPLVATVGATLYQCIDYAKTILGPYDVQHSLCCCDPILQDLSVLSC
jgi:hypothetical protein